MNPKFKPVPGLVGSVDQVLLQNNDLRNLIALCLLVQAGPGPKGKQHLNAFKCEPGKVSNARWVTLANNCLIHYMQLTKPSKELTLIVRIVVNIYAPSIIKIKKEFHVANGPKHLFTIFSLAKDLFKGNVNKKYLDCVKHTLQTNGFHAHIENMLVCMALDDNKEVQEKAIDIIKRRREIGEPEEIKSQRLVMHAKEEKYKKQNCPLSDVRKFKVPELNWSANSYYELIDIDKVEPTVYSSPPLFANYSIDEIKEKKFDQDFFRIPVHSQAVERAVYLTSIAAETVVGYEDRHGFILNKIKRAEKVPINFNRNHFRKLAECPF